MADKDEMLNNWGCNLIMSTGNGSGRSFESFDTEVKRSVPGYQLHTTEASGTAANETAIKLATNYNNENCLFALGSYLGGGFYLQEMSTTHYTAKSLLSFPKKVEDVYSDACLKQTVPFPYFIDCEKFTTSDRKEIEDLCLKAFHKRVVIGKLTGKPVKAILFEFILGGCGGELHVDYLLRLAKICKRFGVILIADEVLTGGRVGPKMTMTSEMPMEVQDCIHYITMGKFLQCGIVLEKIPTPPVAVYERNRGTSTHLECGQPCQLWAEVAHRMDAGLLGVRRAQVIQLFKKRGGDDPELYWGRGLLMFVGYSRNPIISGLKQRILPMMEGTKLTKLNCQLSKWNRSTTCEYLLGRAKEWLSYEEEAYKTSPKAFTAALTDYLLSDDTVYEAMGSCKMCSFFQFRPEDVLHFIGSRASKLLATHLRDLRKQEKVKCSLDAHGFLREAILTAIKSCSEDRAVYKKRKGGRRVEYVMVDSSLFVQAQGGNKLS